jgi:hypothetical protein
LSFSPTHFALLDKNPLSAFGGGVLKNMKTIQKLSFALLATVGAAAGLRAQSTAFTYHGRLNNNGAPVTGTHDMQFSIFDAEAGNGLVAGPLPANAVGVTNGLFTARIDFGAGVFTGPPRWLEISVRPAGVGNFTTLSPRQELTSSPYAIRAQSAGIAADVVNGAVVKSLNGLRDNVTLAAGTNLTLTANGNTLTIGSSSSLWALNGTNAYYNGGNVGIGTPTPQGLLDLFTGNGSDSSALFVRADPGSFGRGGIIHHQSATYGWQELAQKTGSATDGFLGFNYVDRTAPGTKVASTVLALRGNGSVGIGTEAPGTKLTVYGGLYGIEHTDGSVRLDTYINGFGAWLGTVSNHKLNFFVNDGGASMAIDTTGNVGIGTNAPATKLHVRGNLTLDSGASPVIYTSTSGVEENRFLQLINSPGFSSAAGLKAGGILVADSYGYATPGKNDLVVKGKVAAGGDVYQARDKGGWVKAMIYVNANGTIARCYNGQTGSSTGNCGFQVNHDGVGDYNVLFGFQVTDRFAAITAHGYSGTFYYGPNVNGLSVYTSYNDGNGLVDCPFTLIVY